MEILNQYFPSVVFHPCETLAEKLEEMGMGPKEFALRTGKPEKTITAVLKGESSVSADMAVQFENVTKIPAYFWLNNQRSYDEYLAREKRKAVIEDALPWVKLFPVSEMIDKGWLPQIKSQKEKAAALLSFFGFARHSAWEDYYFHQQLKVAFGISLADIKEPYSISAWLRQGELQAADLKANNYVEKSFKEALPKLKSLMVEQAEDFYGKLQLICLEAGVKVVFTPCLSKAPLGGSTRWINNTPLIQLTSSYDRNDSFWFTFFHEAGHILLHGKKDIFLEQVDYSGKEPEKEQQADNFAFKWTLSEEEKEISPQAPASHGDIHRNAFRETQKHDTKKQLNPN